MKVTPEIRLNLETEIEKSRFAIEKAQQRLSSWSGSAKQIELITSMINQHWPRIVFINSFLNKQIISQEDFEIIQKGTLNESELRKLKQQ